MGRMELKSHRHRRELHMPVPLVKLPLGKFENTGAKEFGDCATTFASFYTIKAVWSGKKDRK